MCLDCRILQVWHNQASWLVQHIAMACGLKIFSMKSRTVRHFAKRQETTHRFCVFSNETAASQWCNPTKDKIACRHLLPWIIRFVHSELGKEASGQIHHLLKPLCIMHYNAIHFCIWCTHMEWYTMIFPRLSRTDRCPSRCSPVTSQEGLASCSALKSVELFVLQKIPFLRCSCMHLHALACASEYSLNILCLDLNDNRASRHWSAKFATKSWRNSSDLFNSASRNWAWAARTAKNCGAVTAFLQRSFWL